MMIRHSNSNHATVARKGRNRRAQDGQNEDLYRPSFTLHRFATDQYGQALRPLKPHPTRIIDLTPAAFTALTAAAVAHGILDDVTVAVPAGNP